MKNINNAQYWKRCRKPEIFIYCEDGPAFLDGNLATAIIKWNAFDLALPLLGVCHRFINIRVRVRCIGLFLCSNVFKSKRTENNLMTVPKTHNETLRCYKTTLNVLRWSGKNRTGAHSAGERRGEEYIYVFECRDYFWKSPHEAVLEVASGKGIRRSGVGQRFHFILYAFVLINFWNQVWKFQ